MDSAANPRPASRSRSRSCRPAAWGDEHEEANHAPARLPDRHRGRPRPCRLRWRRHQPTVNRRRHGERRLPGHRDRHWCAPVAQCGSRPRDQFGVQDHSSRVPRGGGRHGQPAGSFGVQTGDGESATSATLPRFYVGVFEVTQGQWARLGGSDTWTAVTTTLVGPSAVVAEKPAFGLSWSGITTTLSAYNSGKTISLALPSDAQWEKACRAGSSSLFAWGDARDDATVTTYAQVWETSAGALGPRAVGSKTANAGILYDMHGNVWEWTSSQYVRGGSWRDTLPQARAANRHDLDIDTNHPLVGARLVLSL